MATREYIGARYVPRFTGLYDNTQIYDALDVVDNGSGTSYIAKKTVPAGTPLTNTDYWFVYGASSGAIINLQQQINEMKDGDVAGSLQNQVDSIEHGLNGPIFTEWNKRKILFLGDSYGQGTICTGLNPDTYTNNYSDGWMSKLIGYLGMDSDHAIAEPTVGASFAKPSGVHWQDAIASLADDPDLNMIFIAGGANDLQANSYDDIINGINAFFTVAAAKFPNAVVAIAMIGFTRWSGSVLKATDVMQAYRNGAINNGGVYIPHAYNVMHCAALFSLDDVHGTAEGYTQIARALYGAMTSGNYEFWYENVFSLNPTGLTDGVVATDWTHYQCIHDNILTMKMSMSINCSATSVTLSNAWTKIGDLTGNNIIGRTDSYGCCAQCQIGLREAGVYYFYSGAVAIKNNSLYMQVLDFDSGTSNWRTRSITQVQIHNAKWVIDNLNRE